MWSKSNLKRIPHPPLSCTTSYLPWNSSDLDYLPLCKSSGRIYYHRVKFHLYRQGDERMNRVIHVYSLCFKIIKHIFIWNQSELTSFTISAHTKTVLGQKCVPLYNNFRKPKMTSEPSVMLSSFHTKSKLVVTCQRVTVMEIARNHVKETLQINNQLQPAIWRKSMLYADLQTVTRKCSDNMWNNREIN